MKATTAIPLALAALALTGAASDAAYAQLPAAMLRPAVVSAAVSINGAVGVDFFYSNLSPYGRWIERPSYGWVWAPRRVRFGWRPYSAGHWVYTDYGWTWVSTEPWGWATYHYGRWYYDPDYGWEWIPGTDWGPAWVSWQQGSGYIGWAPLPPAVGFSAGVGLALGGFNLSVGLAPHYCFVPERSFLSLNVTNYIVPPARNVTIINNTTNITNYTVVNNRVVNQSINVQHVEQVTGQRVHQLQVAEVHGASAQSARVSGNTLRVFRPNVVKSASTPPPSAVIKSTGAAVSQTQLQRQHQSEQKALAAQHQNEFDRLKSIHRNELKGGARTPAQPTNQGSSPAGGAKAAGSTNQLSLQQQTEIKAMQDQHRREHARLAARHNLDLQNAGQAAKGGGSHTNANAYRSPPPAQPAASSGNKGGGGRGGSSAGSGPQRTGGGQPQPKAQRAAPPKKPAGGHPPPSRS
ncbi:MAG TPA: DUF6600 domain-containing protein [Thermoanaerobaculia bacterium]|nr:DUF6600 domain-containing protein [Thermoanaerobaculia bacterium]